MAKQSRWHVHLLKTQTDSLPWMGDYLKNEFNFWNVDGIMDSLGLLQSNFLSQISRLLLEPVFSNFAYTFM